MTELRQWATETLVPALLGVQLPDDACALLLSYVGLDGGEKLMSTEQINNELVCLVHYWRHVRFCEKLLWALLDPTAPQHIEPWFYIQAPPGGSS